MLRQLKDNSTYITIQLEKSFNTLKFMDIKGYNDKGDEEMDDMLERLT